MTSLMAYNDIAFGSIFFEIDRLDVDYLDIPKKKVILIM